MNYFNYFTEIEEAFVRRRGKHLLLSPMDWALIESWKKMGVPLHIALRGIECAFDSYNARPRKRSVKSLLYCQEEVEAQFAEWLERQQGAALETGDNNGNGSTQQAHEDAQLPFTRASILAHLNQARETILQRFNERRQTKTDDLCEALERASVRLEELSRDFACAVHPDAEKLEASLTDLEALLDEAIWRSTAPDRLALKTRETDEQLQPYRNRMEQATYEQTRRNLLFQRLREECGVPRLSLFYL